MLSCGLCVSVCGLLCGFASLAPAMKATSIYRAGASMHALSGTGMRRPGRGFIAELGQQVAPSAWSRYRTSRTGNRATIAASLSAFIDTQQGRRRPNNATVIAISVPRATLNDRARDCDCLNDSIVTSLRTSQSVTDSSENSALKFIHLWHCSDHTSFTQSYPR